MPVVPFEVRTGYRVEARDGELGVVREIFNGPPRSMFVDAEPYAIGRINPAFRRRAMWWWTVAGVRPRAFASPEMLAG